MTTLKTLTGILLIKALSMLTALPTPSMTQESIIEYVRGGK